MKIESSTSESAVSTTTSTTATSLSSSSTDENDQEAQQSSTTNRDGAVDGADSASAAEDEEAGAGRADSTVPNADEDIGNSDNGVSSLILSEALPSSSLEKIDFERGSHNRVKLYVLADQRSWDDRGTGHVACLQSPDQQQSDNTCWCIIVRLEANEKNVLESKIQLDTIYQKQQGTLIVWSESETCDLALSFQEKAGCTELWEKICRIQGKDPDTEAEQEENECEENEPSDSSTSGVSNACAASFSIPPCTLQHLGDLEQALSNNMFANSQREKMATAILQNGYITKLCELFELCDALEDTKVLNQFASIAKNLFLLNSNAILNELIDEKHFRNIVGMLEYDSSFVEPKRHREFLWERSKFREVLPISSDELKAKIHQTFRLQYVQDVCLPAPSIFEENLLTVLNSHLFFIRGDIVTSLLNDKELLQQLFEELQNPAIDPERQRDLTNFLKEFCSFAHSLQPSGPQGKEQFFKTLLDNNVLGTIDPCISSSLPSTRTATIELLTIMVDFNPQLLRDFLMKQSRLEGKNEALLINKLIKHMLSDRDAEFTAGAQMSQVLRILVDPESIMAEKGEFLQMFYKRAMQSLCASMTENARDGQPICDTYYIANRTTLIIDLLCFFVEHHGHNMRTYTIANNLIQSVLVYLQSKHHFLALCALRLIRRIISLKDDTYVRHICDKCILDKIVSCFVANGQRYNLLNSAMIELFEFIKSERIFPLIEYTMRKHWEVTFARVAYVQTFGQMHDQWENHLAKVGEDGTGGGSGGDTPSKENVAMTPPNAQWRKEREHDDEELFFSKEDDDEIPPMQYRKSGLEPLFPSLLRKRKASDDDGMASVFGGNITPPAGSHLTPSSRISQKKIMIRMGAYEPTTQTQATASSRLNGVDSTSSNPNGGVGVDGESPPIAEEPTPPSSSAIVERQTSSPSADKTSSSGVGAAMKRPLVDYDDSDDEDEDDGDGEEEDRKTSTGGRANERKGSSAVADGHPNAPGAQQQQLGQPSKLPKMTLDEGPPSPPPDPDGNHSNRSKTASPSAAGSQ